jgi:hypothetical protein
MWPGSTYNRTCERDAEGSFTDSSIDSSVDSSVIDSGMKIESSLLLMGGGLIQMWSYGPQIGSNDWIAEMNYRRDKHHSRGLMQMWSYGPQIGSQRCTPEV